MDKKLSRKFGDCTSPTEWLFTHYEFPQEKGNHQANPQPKFNHVSSTSLRATFSGKTGSLNFSNMRFKAKDFKTTQHPYGRHPKKLKSLMVTLAWDDQRLGSRS